MAVTYRAGGLGFCDVCTTPQGFAWVYEVGEAVVCEFTYTFRTLVPEPMMFLRCAYVPQWEEVVAIAQGHDSGTAYLIRRNGVTALGATFGVQPVAINSTHAYVVRSGQQYDVIQLTNGQTVSLPHGIRGSSQGIRWIDGDGDVVWADETHVTLAGFVILHEYVRDGLLTLGQADPAQIGGTYGTQPFTAISGLAYEPHCAQRGDEYAICARTPRGAAFTVVNVHNLPPFITNEQPPAPDPQPEPAPVPDLPDQTSVVASVRAKYPTPLGAGHAACLMEIALTIGHGAGLYRKASGTNIQLPDGTRVSQDVIMFADGACYDCLGDAEGEARPTWGFIGTEADKSKYYAVAAVPDPGTPVPNPGTPPPPTEVLKRLDAIEARLQRLETAGLVVAQVYRP